MSDDISTNPEQETQSVRSVLEALSIGELRQKAVKNFGLKLSRDHTKEDIVNLILSVSAKHNFVQASEGELKPGWARIKIHKNPMSTQDMVFFNCNGYQGLIPIGIEVDVPIKLLEVLDHAEEMKISKQNEFGQPVWGLESSYPYSLLGKIEGPDPRPGFEKQRDRKIAGKKGFFKKFGIYPTDKMYTQFVMSGNKFNPYDYGTEEEAE